MDEILNRTECPKCNTSWVGVEIPKKVQEQFGGRTHYSRLLAIYDRDADVTVIWRCPDCRYIFSRLEET